VREYTKEETESFVYREEVYGMKKRENNKKLFKSTLVAAVVIVLLACIAVVAFDIDVRAIPKAVIVVWCTLVSYIVTWAATWGM